MNRELYFRTILLLVLTIKWDRQAAESELEFSKIEVDYRASNDSVLTGYAHLKTGRTHKLIIDLQTGSYNHKITN